MDTFRVRDGWVKILDFPSEFNEGAAVATSGGVAFAGSGINNTNGLANEILNQFWQFDPLNETWQEATPFSNDPANKVTNSSMFTLGDTVYMIFGHHNIPNILMVRNFWKYAISSNTWYDASFEIPFTNAAFSGRSGATGFVLGNSFYVGTGQIIINNNRKYFHDFWQYTPQTGRWRRVKSLPLNASSGVQWQGRYEAIGFASADHGYVGGGELYGVPSTDFWRFTPPVGIQDSGLWELMPQSLPGVGRIGAIHFTLNGKAFYGCGYNVVERGLSDFYAFDFLTEQWTTKTPFQGGRRYNMISFGSNGNGYCGTGIEIQTINSGQTGQPFVHRDFWRYIPETP